MKGPRITVSIGQVSVYNIPKRAAMAVSRTLNEHFTANPHSKELHFEAGSLETKAVRILLISWLRDTSKIFEAHQVHFRKQFHSNIAILRAARLLGMECYTNSILQYSISYMKTEVPHYHEIACVEAMHTSYKDPECGQPWSTTSRTFDAPAKIQGRSRTSVGSTQDLLVLCITPTGSSRSRTLRPAVATLWSNTVSAVTRQGRRCGLRAKKLRCGGLRKYES